MDPFLPKLSEEKVSYLVVPSLMDLKIGQVSLHPSA